jgi:putative 4-mercaptohistidine N1-methyltranferase
MAGYYDTDRGVAEYLLFHYGPDETVLPWSFGPREALGFAVRCVSETLLRERLPPEASALDLGCAVGRSAFELSRHCASVTAIDTSARFIEAALALQREGVLRFSAQVEGTLARPVTARLPAGIERSRVRFETGDALNPRPDLGRFDVVLAANLIDRVPRPRELLKVMAGLVKPGGQLILTSPYTWLESYTDPGEWLCAEGRPTSEILPELLPGFERVRRLDLPFLIREHHRKYQWSVAEATVWVRG